MWFPDEPTTPEQWQVIAWAFIVVLTLLGSVGLFYSVGAPAEKADVAAEIRGYSLAVWAVAAAIYGVKRALERFLG